MSSNTRLMTSPRRNFHIVSAALFVWAVLVIARLIYLQVFQFNFLTHQARRQQERTIEVAPVRGVIYDRNFHPLAMSVEVDSIFAVPGEISNPDTAAKVLSPVLHMGVEDLMGKLQGRRFFSWVKRKVSGQEAAQVRQLNLHGIYFQKENKRFYPNRELAAHVLGYVDLDDHGLGGVELGYEKTIRGRPGQLLIETDARQNWLGRAGRPPEPGQNLVLTLDENIQYVAERELAAAMSEYRALTATVIVQDPRTGEILAMANQPTFNPNTYADAKPDVFRNTAVGASYEPGSTFKIVTVAAALEEKLTTPLEPIDCQMGSILVAGHVIHDHKKYGILSTSEIIQNSSDVGAIKLALRVGNGTMYRYLRSFGFGAPTGIELPGEARGLTKPPERWSKISIGAIAMGQEVGVTPLQLVTAASVVVNGGWWVRPHIVREGFRGARGGAPNETGEGRRVISEETAAALRKMMTMVVTNGTAKTAQLNGYTSAGKTGTAQKIDPSTGRYSKSNYVASFVGFAPAEAPLFTILVVVDSPHGKIYGGDVAAPVFKRISEQILAYRNMPPTQPTKPLLAKASWTPPETESIDLAPPVSLGPLGEAVDANSTALVNLDSGLAVPDFVGKTVRAVAEESQTGGIVVQMVGSGIAYQQSPMPGIPLPDGQKVQVWFKVGGRAAQTAEMPRQSPQKAQPARHEARQLSGQDSGRHDGNDNGRNSTSDPSTPTISQPEPSKQQSDQSISSGALSTPG